MLICLSSVSEFSQLSFSACSDFQARPALYQSAELWAVPEGWHNGGRVYTLVTTGTFSTANDSKLKSLLGKRHRSLFSGHGPAWIMSDPPLFWIAETFRRVGGGNLGVSYRSASGLSDSKHLDIGHDNCIYENFCMLSSFNIRNGPSFKLSCVFCLFCLDFHIFHT